MTDTLHDHDGSTSGLTGNALENSLYDDMNDSVGGDLDQQPDNFYKSNTSPLIQKRGKSPLTQGSSSGLDRVSYQECSTVEFQSPSVSLVLPGLPQVKVKGSDGKYYYTDPPSVSSIDPSDNNMIDISGSGFLVGKPLTANSKRA